MKLYLKFSNLNRELTDKQKTKEREKALESVKIKTKIKMTGSGGLGGMGSSKGKQHIRKCRSVGLANRKRTPQAKACYKPVVRNKVNVKKRK